MKRKKCSLYSPLMFWLCMSTTHQMIPIYNGTVYNKKINTDSGSRTRVFMHSAAFNDGAMRQPTCHKGVVARGARIRPKMGQIGSKGR